MDACGRWRWLRAIVLALALTLVASSVELVLTSPGASIALAGQGDDKKDTKNKGNDDDEDHFARGMVISIDTLKDPPEVTLAAFDGEMVVRVLKTDEISLNGLRTCHHIRVDGEKIHELLFEATKIEVEDGGRKC